MNTKYNIDEGINKTNSLTNELKHGFGKRNAVENRKSIMSTIILKISKQTIKQSFVKLSHKNKGNLKLVLQEDFKKSRPYTEFLFVKVTKKILVH